MSHTSTSALALQARHDAGFSLVEILVGLGIGMVGMIIMLQVFSVSEGYKRNTTGGDDAQTGGAIAMYTLQRDLRQAGYGTSSESVIGCSMQLPNGAVLPSFAPVLINPPATVIPPGDPATDRILITIGNGNGPPEGSEITTYNGAATYTVNSSTLFATSDFVIASVNGVNRPCAWKIARITNITGGDVTVDTGETTLSAFTNSRFKYLHSLGNAPKILAYAIRGGRLTVCDYMVTNCGTASVSNSTIWVPIADSIVSMRAQYARASNITTTQPSNPLLISYVADTYDQVTPIAAAAPQSWLALMGVRVVLVARNEQYDKNEITTAAPRWQGSADPTMSVDLSNDPNWKHFRYRAFETTIPIRNLTSNQGLI